MQIDPAIRDKILNMDCLKSNNMDMYYTLLKMILEDNVDSNINFNKISQFFRNKNIIICDCIEKFHAKIKHSDFKFTTYRFNLICKEREIIMTDTLFKIMECYYYESNKILGYANILGANMTSCEDMIYKVCDTIYIYDTGYIAILFHINVIKKIYEDNLQSYQK
jgi:hypothetical protein